MLQLRPAEERGEANYGWLQSSHSFSFANYYDPKHMGHGHLLVINDDIVAPGAGFGAHPHRNMEILSYIMSGSIVHKDSQGNQFEVPAGEFQLMSAGSGIMHSEFNASKTAPLKFFQIWVKPNVGNTQPGYQQRNFPDDVKNQLVFSPDGENGSLKILQQAWLSRVKLDEGESSTLPLERTDYAYVHVVKGQIAVNDLEKVKAGDGIKISAETSLSFKAFDDVELLLFEV